MATIQDFIGTFLALQQLSDQRAAQRQRTAMEQQIILSGLAPEDRAAYLATTGLGPEFQAFAQELDEGPTAIANRLLREGASAIEPADFARKQLLGQSLGERAKDELMVDLVNNMGPLLGEEGTRDFLRNTLTNMFTGRTPEDISFGAAEGELSGTEKERAARIKRGLEVGEPQLSELLLRRDIAENQFTQGWADLALREQLGLQGLALERAKLLIEAAAAGGGAANLTPAQRVQLIQQAVKIREDLTQGKVLNKEGRASYLRELDRIERWLTGEGLPQSERKVGERSFWERFKNVFVP